MREGKKGTAKEMLMSAHAAPSVFSETKQPENSVLPDTPSSSFRSRLSLPKCQPFFNLVFLPVAARANWNCQHAPFVSNLLVSAGESRLKEYFTQKLNYVLISSHLCHSKPMTSYHETHGELLVMVLLDAFSCSERGLKLSCFTKHAEGLQLEMADFTFYRSIQIMANENGHKCL